MDNDLDHSFERKLLSMGRKLQLTLGPWSYLTRMANFNLKKIDEWMKTWWINIFTFFEMLARIFVFLFSNN